MEAVRVDEVRDHFDRLLRPEVLRGLLLQPLRDRGDAVGHLDAELRDRQVARVAADERDVGAVQRRDDFQVACRRGSAARGAR